MPRNADYNYDYDDGRRDNRRITMDEADEILDEARGKDFWAVDFPYDNRDRLQDAVDRVYNSIPGNKYEVDYMNNQNGSRLMIRCVTCGKELTSFDPFITHEKGKPHKKVRQQQLNPKDPNLKGGLQRRSHNEVKGIFPPKSLEERVDFTEDPVLGMQFVYKEEINNKKRFTCQLCCKKEDCTRINTKDMFRHVKSKPHLQLYMDVKFGDLRTTPFSNLFDIVEDTEKLEGKIHVPVVDFTKQMLAHQIKMEGSIKQEYGIKREFPIKREYPIKQERLKIKRERSTSSSDSSESSYRRSARSKKLKQQPQSSWSDRSSEEERAPSPPIFRVKAEPKTPPRPLVSPEYNTPPAPVPPPRPTMVHKAMITDGPPMASLSQLADDAGIFRTEEAIDQLLEDRDMQNLLTDSLYILNRQLYEYFQARETICWDDKGHVVNKAADCALGLETKHLSRLESISREIQ